MTGDEVELKWSSPLLCSGGGSVSNLPSTPATPFLYCLFVCCPVKSNYSRWDNLSWQNRLPGPGAGATQVGAPGEVCAGPWWDNTRWCWPQQPFLLWPGPPPAIWLPGALSQTEAIMNNSPRSQKWIFPGWLWGSQWVSVWRSWWRSRERANEIVTRPVSPHRTTGLRLTERNWESADWLVNTRPARGVLDHSDNLLVLGGELGAGTSLLTAHCWLVTGELIKIILFLSQLVAALALSPANL